jgi:hypothetical protein
VATSTVSVRVTTASGDEETVTLVKSGALFRGTIETTLGEVKKSDGVLQTRPPADVITAVYSDANTGSGTSTSVTTTAQLLPPYTITLSDNEFTFSGETALNLRFDEAWSFRDLPFSFPFLGQEYKRVFVNTNGFLSFISTFGALNSRTRLLPNLAVAPLWWDLKTNGTLQPSEDVYVSQPTADSISFRWAAETFAFDLKDARPVNFAVTLFRDGRIKFTYGMGNKDFIPVYSGQFGPPTVGISRGTETFAQFVETHDGNPNLEKAKTVIFTPGPAEMEPNNTLEQANLVPIGASVSGVLDPAGDVDFFGFAAAAGQQIVIDVDAQTIGSVADTVMTLFDSTGRQLAENDDESSASVDSLLQFTIPADGRYFFRLRDTRGKGGPSYTYRVTLAVRR